MSAAGLFVPAACGWAAGPKMAWSKGFKWIRAEVASRCCMPWQVAACGTAVLSCRESFETERPPALCVPAPLPCQIAAGGQSPAGPDAQEGREAVSSRHGACHTQRPCRGGTGARLDTCAPPRCCSLLPCIQQFVRRRGCLRRPPAARLSPLRLPAGTTGQIRRRTRPLMCSPGSWCLRPRPSLGSAPSQVLLAGDSCTGHSSLESATC